MDNIDAKSGVLMNQFELLSTCEREDSVGRMHQFTEETLLAVANNTNEHLRNGGQIPIAKNFAKTPNDIVGVCDSNNATFSVADGRLVVDLSLEDFVAPPKPTLFPAINMAVLTVHALSTEVISDG